VGMVLAVLLALVLLLVVGLGLVVVVVGEQRWILLLRCRGELTEPKDQYVSEWNEEALASVASTILFLLRPYFFAGEAGTPSLCGAFRSRNEDHHARIIIPNETSF
jgi:uncharacterized BrkB/YihY/UPF0761 family membrane protein